MEHFQRLLDQAKDLGSSRRRYLYNLEQGLPGLVGRLEAAGKRERLQAGLRRAPSQSGREFCGYRRSGFAQIRNLRPR